jgi:hypothetical protein
MEVKFIEMEPVTSSHIYGTICRKYDDRITTFTGIMAVKYSSDNRVSAIVHTPAPDDDEDAWPCDLLESKCFNKYNSRLAKYLETHEFSIKSLLVYYGMREDEAT